MSDRIHVLAKAELQRSDWKLLRALERSIAGEAWCNWRDEIRRLVRDPGEAKELPPEPPFGVFVASEPAPVIEPPPPEPPPRDQIPAELERFAEADETAHDFRERIKNLWQRFGIREGHHTADMPPLTADEKIAMREIDIANSLAGNWIGR